MDDRYPDFWAESNWPRRPRRDPFRVRLVALLVAGALLTPIALLMRRNDGEVVTTGRLPGAAVALEPVLGGTATTTTPAPPLLPSPEVAAGTLPPVAGATTAVASAVAPAAAGSAAGTLPPTLGTLPEILAAPAPSASTRSSGGGESGAASGSNGSGASGSGASGSGASGSGGSGSGGSGSGGSGSGGSGSGGSGSGASGSTQAPASRPATNPEPKTTAAPHRAAPARPSTTAAPAQRPTPTPPPVAYTSDQVEVLIRQVFPDDQEEKALAVAWRESRHDPRAYNGWCCYGLFQIYFEVNAKFLATLGITTANQLFDPVLNATAAFAMYQRSGWQPWGG